MIALFSRSSSSGSLISWQSISYHHFSLKHALLLMSWHIELLLVFANVRSILVPLANCVQGNAILRVLMVLIPSVFDGLVRNFGAISGNFFFGALYLFECRLNTALVLALSLLCAKSPSALLVIHCLQCHRFVFLFVGESCRSGAEGWAAIRQ